MIKVRMWPLTSSENTNIFIDLIKCDNVFYLKHSWFNTYNLKFDVFHMHWPETYLNIKNPLKRYVMSFVVILYLLFLNICRKKVIWTVHNLAPHENYNKYISFLFYKIVAKLSSNLIFMTKYSKEKFFLKYGEFDNFEIISHPLYPHPKVTNNGQINCQYKGFLFFGLIRPYKNVEKLIELFNTLGDGFKLNIVGNIDDNYKKIIIDRVKNKNINLVFGRYSEDELQRYLNSCDGVILPYKEITNSGVLFRIFSSETKILLPDIEYTREILSNINYNYIFYNEDITVEHLKKLSDLKNSFNENNIISFNNNIRYQYFYVYRD